MCGGVHDVHDFHGQHDSQPKYSTETEGEAEHSECSEYSPHISKQGLLERNYCKVKTLLKEDLENHLKTHER